MTTIAEAIFIWGMAAATVAMPTGLIVMWALCRKP